MNKKIILTSLILILTIQTRAQWRNANVSSDFRPYGMDFFAGKTGISVGRTDLTTAVFRTTDGGINWTAIQDDNLGKTGYLPVVECVNANLAYAAGRSIGGHENLLLKTTDAGLSWDSVPAIFHGCTDFSRLMFSDENTGYATMKTTNQRSRNALTKTTDGGLNWYVIKQFEPGTSEFTTMYVTSQNKIFLIFYDYFNYYFYNSNDGGATWDSTLLDAVPSYLNATDIYFENDNKGFIICSSAYSVVTTTDAGKNWIRKTDVSYYKKPFAIKFLNPMEGFLAGEGDRIWHTIDGGNTWKEIYVPNPDDINENYEIRQPHFFNNKEACAISHLGSNAYLRYNHTIDVSNNAGIDHPQRTANFIYPNPAKTTVRIDPNMRISEINLYTITGAFVKSVVVDPDHTLINIEDISSGLYVIKAKSDQGVFTCKFIKD